MTLQFYDGFESGLALRQANSVVASSTPSPVTTTGRTGGIALSSNSGAGVGASACRITLPNAISTLVLGAGRYFTTDIRGASAATYSELIGLIGTSGWELSINVNAAGRLELRAGSGNAGTLLATGTTVAALNAWHYIEVKATLANSGGICIVKMDGVTEINYTGDTLTTNGTATFSGLSFTLKPVTGSGSTITPLDDVVVCDAGGSAPFNNLFGDRAVKAIRPDGNGSSSQWVGSDGNSTDNYLLVDESPPSAADYVQDSTPGNRDLYTFGNLSLSGGTVDAVQVLGYAAKIDGGERTVKMLQRTSGGTLQTSPGATLSSTYLIREGEIRTLDPDGSPWSESSLNAATFGVETG